MLVVTSMHLTQAHFLVRMSMENKIQQNTSIMDFGIDLITLLSHLGATIFPCQTELSVTKYTGQPSPTGELPPKHHWTLLQSDRFMIREIWRSRYSYYNLLSNHSVRRFASETEAKERDGLRRLYKMVHPDLFSDNLVAQVFTKTGYYLCVSCGFLSGCGINRNH
jgi:hypothetical protein